MSFNTKPKVNISYEKDASLSQSLEFFAFLNRKSFNWPLNRKLKIYILMRKLDSNDYYIKEKLN